MSPPISCLWWTLGVNYALEVKCLFFFPQGSETNVPTYFLSVLNTDCMCQLQNTFKEFKPLYLVILYMYINAYNAEFFCLNHGD